MDKEQIKTAMRQAAETQFHDRLKSIDAEVDERFAQLQIELAVIDEAEKRSQAMFEQMRQAAAVRHGLSVEPLSHGVEYFGQLNDPRSNP